MGSHWTKVVGDTVCGVVDAATNLLYKLKADCGCEIPETRCPPRCVGTITWAVGRGATPQATITVRNTGKVTRTFHFAATPLAGIDVGPAKLLVTPTSATLAPGGTAVVQLALKGTSSLTPGQAYHGEFHFTGAWERCVKLECEVLEESWDECRVDVAGPNKGLHHPRGKLAWEVQRGVLPSGRITVVNHGTEPQTFIATASQWVGPNGAAAAVELHPRTLTVAPGESGGIDVRIPDTMVLSPLQEYHCDVTLQGQAAHPVALRCEVERDPAGHLVVEQGELPTRLVAKEWYVHFQCTEDCDPTSTSQHEHAHHGCCG